MSDGVRAKAWPVIGAVVIVASVSTWLGAAERTGTLPSGHFRPAPTPDWNLTGAGALATRNDAFRRAAVRLDVLGRDVAEGASLIGTEHAAGRSPVVCRFLADEPTGTSPKFDCVLDTGGVIKVKYGRNPEIFAETAASMLLTRLGYAADRVEIVEHLRCYGCPRHPFLTSRLLWFAGLPDALAPHGYDNAYTEFEWVSVESRFEAPAIETETVEGWAWYELARSEVPRADLDAFRLLAAFLAHWDNKSENQRLVCLDDTRGPDGTACAQPLLMIQDLGATFGPAKVNLANWRDRPLWFDRSQCIVSMRAMPFRGATYPDVQISDAGRVQLGRQLASMSDDDIRELFVDAQFHRYHTGTDDERDIEAWTTAFRHRMDQVLTAGPCPNPPAQQSPTTH